MRVSTRGHLARSVKAEQRRGKQRPDLGLCRGLVQVVRGAPGRRRELDGGDTFESQTCQSGLGKFSFR